MLPGKSLHGCARAASKRPGAVAWLVLAALAALPGAARAQEAQAAFTATAASEHTLSIEALGTGGGTVTVSPTCGAPCTFPEGTVVTLVATPDESSTFDGFGEPCGSTGVCHLYMNADQSMTVTFTSSPVPTYPLTVVTSGTGRGSVVSSVGGIYCIPSCTGRIPEGTVVTLTVRTYESTFDGWSGVCAGATSTCVFAMTAAETVGATFTAIPVQQRTLTVLKAGTGTGTVTMNGTCESPCVVRDGFIARFTVTADAGSRFDGMRVQTTGTSDGSFFGCGNGSCEATVMGGDVTLTFTFTAEDPPTPCANPVDFTYGSGSFDTTGAVCYRTAMSVRGWGCSSFEGRTVSVNGGPATGACGAGPFPLPRAADGYTYFSISPGRFPWATIYAWTW